MGVTEKIAEMFIANLPPDITQKVLQLPAMVKEFNDRLARVENNVWMIYQLDAEILAQLRKLIGEPNGPAERISDDAEKLVGRADGGNGTEHPGTAGAG
jgi:hypothetical protein